MHLYDLPLGARIRDYSCSIHFLVAAHDHPGYSGTTLVTDGIIGQGCFDAMEPASPHRPHRDWGNNDYRLSTLRQWLNAEDQIWFSPSHVADAPPVPEHCWDGDSPYAGRAGFLYPFSPTFRQAIQTVSVKTACRKGRLETDSARVFLLSRTEVGLGDESGCAEGRPLPLFSDFRFRLAAPAPEAFAAATYTPFAFASGRPWCWWLRTPYVTRMCRARLVYSDGMLTSNYTACGAVGIRPALVLRGELKVSALPGLPRYYSIIPQ